MLSSADARVVMHDPTPGMHRLTVPPEAEGLRADAWLRQSLSGLSRSRIQTLMREGRVQMNSRTVAPDQRLRPGETVRVEIPPPRPIALEPQAIALDVLYEDADILVLNKPAGLVVHPAAGHADGTLVNALLHHCRDLRGVGGELRPGIVHRLDKDTSGALVVAKHGKALEGLAAAFKQGAVNKRYTAIVKGIPVAARRRIETLIGRSAGDRKKMSAAPPRGRAAVTEYAVMECFRQAACLDVRIETGRTHQIRVHLAHIGHPVLGDRQYGRGGTAGLPHMPSRQMLHARRLAFVHPTTGEAMDLEAPLPEDMLAVLSALRQDAA